MTVSVQAGTKARVLNPDGTPYHAFDEGDIVTAIGEDHDDTDLGLWARFENEDGDTQYLLPIHYEVIEAAKVKAAPVRAPEIIGEAKEVVDTALPTKVVYGIVTKDDEVIASTFSREYAREMKSALGGKRSGVRIFAFAATKEIR